VATSPGRSGRRQGRPAGSPPNREAILASAHRQFVERGYDGATIRSIAAGAGVDAALVHHYFGTKDRLLLATLQELAQVDVATPQLLAGGIAGLGERVIRATVEVFETLYQPILPALLGLFFSAMAHEDAARQLQESFGGGGVVRLVEALGLPQPDLRAALVGSQLFSLMVARLVVRLEPIASADIDSLVTWYAPTLQRYLTEPLPGDDAPSPRRPGEVDSHSPRS
jgi:AcrR family transcriptional regulator